MPERPVPPIRDPQTPGYVAAHMLEDGGIPPVDQNGNFVVGPTHDAHPMMTEPDDGFAGQVHEFVMESSDSTIYPGIARDEGTFGSADPDNPARLIVTTSRPKPYSRKAALYLPPDSDGELPFVVGTDGPDRMLFVALDNLIRGGVLPPMAAISLRSGGGDAQGSQRGLEYDTMSGVYAEFVETEVIPRLEEDYGITLTRDPDKRIAMGCSSGAAASFSMAWYHNDLYRRVLSLSGTYINQQWPWNPDSPKGAWGYHEDLIPNHSRRSIRIWMAVADQDLYNPNVMRDGMHDWVLANERMAHVLEAKGYDYQFSFVRNARHCDPRMKAQLLPQALEWLWREAVR